MERGRIQGLPKFFWVPIIISGMGKATNFKFGRYIHRSIRTKPFKILGENGAWAYPGTAQISWVPPIISGSDKATNFKFCTHIFSIDRNKSPLQISGKVAGCVVRTLETFQGTHILGASRGRLCDSSAVMFFYGNRFNGVCSHIADMYISSLPLFLSSPTVKRKLSFRQDDRAMRPIYGCPENFRQSLSMPTANSDEIYLMGFYTDRSYECAHKIWGS